MKAYVKIFLWTYQMRMLLPIWEYPEYAKIRAQKEDEKAHDGFNDC